LEGASPSCQSPSGGLSIRRNLTFCISGPQPKQ
jgi:hypothetical protein